MGWLNEPTTDTQISHGDRLWLYIISGFIVLLLVLPTLIVIPMSFSDSQFLEFPPQIWSLRWYTEYLNTPRWINATYVSFKVATLTMIVATPLGTMAAYGLFIFNHPISKIIFCVLITPIIVPLILIAIGTFYVFGQIGFTNTITGIVLAHSVLAIPLVMIIITSALRSYDMNQELVARSLGASRIRAFFEVTLPQIKFSIITSALLAFITSFDEVIISIFISGGQTATLTKQMFSALRDYIDPTIAAISTFMILISTMLMLGAQQIEKLGKK